jgi:hypothetical protein
MIWIIPFFWIMLLKSIASPTSDSDKFKDKTKSENSTPYEERNPNMMRGF